MGYLGGREHEVVTLAFFATPLVARDRSRPTSILLCTRLYIYIYIYIYRGDLSGREHEVVPLAFFAAPLVAVRPPALLCFVFRVANSIYTLLTTLLTVYIRR